MTRGHDSDITYTRVLNFSFCVLSLNVLTQSISLLSQFRRRRSPTSSTPRHPDISGEGSGSRPPQPTNKVGLGLVSFAPLRLSDGVAQPSDGVVKA